MQPTSYIITQQSQGISLLQSRLTQAQCLRWSWPFVVWPAVNGSEVDSAAWRRIGVRLLEDRGKMRDRPGAQGCWHSHFALWQHCVGQDQPIIVLEHDVDILGGWQAQPVEQGVIKLHDRTKHKQNTITGEWSTGAYAYVITPRWARTLIEHAQEHGAQALDKHIGDRAVPWQYSRQVLARHRGGHASTTAAIRKGNLPKFRSHGRP